MEVHFKNQFSVLQMFCIAFHIQLPCSAISTEMQSLKISQNEFENDLMAVMTQISMSNGGTKGTLAAQLLTAIKESDDAKLIEHHK